MLLKKDYEGPRVGHSAREFKSRNLEMDDGTWWGCFQGKSLANCYSSSAPVQTYKKEKQNISRFKIPPRIPWGILGRNPLLNMFRNGFRSNQLGMFHWGNYYFKYEFCIFRGHSSFEKISPDGIPNSKPPVHGPIWTP